MVYKNSRSEANSIQGVIDYTGTETFAEEPMLVKLLRKLKLMPVGCHKKCPLVFLVCL